MSRSPSPLAVLGPTNTGKTHFALERMAAFKSGIMAFPLRLLARENYDKLVKIKGKSSVALVTGEEKIIPASPSYWMATAEAMPLGRQVEFFALDEVQLAADTERGHVFTDRLLNERGNEETLFLGSESIRPLLKRLIPDCRFSNRARLSKLCCEDVKKLSELPPRSAVVAFSVAEVYEIAERLRRRRGGAALVLGALSPRTRNAQVALFQSGEVDFLVATDAIGMGLNLDLDHLSFAARYKFDGRSRRALTLSEIGQIAGRAGRFRNNGTFSVLPEAGGFSPDVVEAVESHSYPPLEQLVWRNRSLDFASPNALLASLERRPPRSELRRVREAEDEFHLRQLLAVPDIRKKARSGAALVHLWEVCQIPDFRKTLTRQHLDLLRDLYRFLVSPQGRIPERWAAPQIAPLQNLEGNMDSLMQRISAIRIWSYISFRPEWLENAHYWQGQTREIENALSDALHLRLTQAFVSRERSVFVRGLKEKTGERLRLGARGNLLLGREIFGQLKGFTLTIYGENKAEQKNWLSLARDDLKAVLQTQLELCLNDDPGTFSLDSTASVLLWRQQPFARLVKGRSRLEPKLRLLNKGAEKLFSQWDLDRLHERGARWLAAHLRNRLEPLTRLDVAGSEQDMGTASRALLFQLGERLGPLLRSEWGVVPDKSDRKALRALGFIWGSQALWLPRLLEPSRQRLLACLTAVFRQKPLSEAEQALLGERPDFLWARPAFEDGELLGVLGYLPLRGKKTLWLRVDILENAASAYWKTKKAESLKVMFPDPAVFKRVREHFRRKKNKDWNIKAAKPLSPFADLKNLSR